KRFALGPPSPPVAFPGRERVLPAPLSCPSPALREREGPTASAVGGGGFSGQISATVSARSPTKSNDQPNNTGSTRAIARSRTWLGLASAKDNSPVNAARAQPRSGSSVVAKYSCISRNLPLRDGVNSKASSSSAKRFTATYRTGNAGVLFLTLENW